MAKKTSKGKEKKLQRKAENEKAQQLKAFLAQLNKASDILESYPAFTRFDRNGLVACLKFFQGGDQLPPSLLDWAFALTKRHMQDLYQGCPNWGWSDASKREELTHPAARFICVFQTPVAGAAAAAAGGEGGQGALVTAEANGVQKSEAPAAAAAGQAATAAADEGQQQQQQQGAAQEEQPVAFMHFRFEEEDGEAVAYLYEIQVDQTAQGKGLGKFMMQLLELIARRSGVARLMLTVFHGNGAARQLYRKLGYSLDEDSPTAVDPASDATYDILTKWLKPRQSL